MGQVPVSSDLSKIVRRNQDGKVFNEFIIKVCELILKQWNICEISTLVVFNRR